ncbi:PWWP domain-containing DNA repair factor 3A-like [Vanacampus margaritifer]
MRGRRRKTRKGEQTKTPRQKRNPSPFFLQEETSPVSDCNFHSDSQSNVRLLQSTPKRGRGRPRKTPQAFTTCAHLHGLSTDRLPYICNTRLEAEDVKDKTFEIESPLHMLRSQSSKRSIDAAPPMTQTTCSPAKRRCYKKSKKITNTASLSERSRPRFELKEDECLFSSDLPIGLSGSQEQMSLLSFPEDEESVDEEELPSFLMQTRPLSITEGVFVWCKFRHFPPWPALVKRVNQKAKKASIIFIDNRISQQKRGMSVALRSLKPFDCEGANELAAEAKEEHAAMLQWSLELITDYRIRIACGSFCGSFLEYFDHGMSYPVRRKHPRAPSEQLSIACESSEQLAIDSKLAMEEEEQSLNLKEDGEQQEQVNKCAKRLLPDRTQAAHNRANEKLVHFIVKQRMVEGRLLAVIRGQVQSRWLQYFQRSNRKYFGVETYLEDNTQLDKVYSYLNELYETAVTTDQCQNVVRCMERIPFVLDVLLPEALTYAIAAMHDLSIKKAEEKYLKGRSLSNRERQAYDLMIEQFCERKILAPGHNALFPTDILTGHN